MLKMEGIQTLKGSWPWPWPSIRPYRIPSCITHRPLPIYRISFKLKKLFVDGRTYGRTYGWTDISPLYIIRSTLGSRPNNVTAFCNLYAKLCCSRVLKRSLSAHLMRVKLLLFTFYLIGCSLYRKTVRTNVNVLDALVFKIRIRTKFQFSTHP